MTMDGYKNSTRTHYMKGGSCEGHAKGGKVKGAAKIAKVMGEFKSGKLHSGSKEGPEVTNPKQAVAIALSEARKAGAKVPVKKAEGGRMMRENITSRPVKVGPTPEERMTRATLGRAERMQAEEANESRIARESRKVTPKTREITTEQRMDTERSVRTPLDERLSRLPSKAEMARRARGPAGAGFSVTPLVNKVRGALGLKNGGLATMPRGKK